MRNVVDKVVSTGNHALLLTERGASFGYNNLVVDMRGLTIMRALGYPVVFDATHSVQLPGGAGDRSGGERRYVPGVGRAADAFGIDSVFLALDEGPGPPRPGGRRVAGGPNVGPIDE